MFWGMGFFFCDLFSYVVGVMKIVFEFIIGKQTHGEQKGLGPSSGTGPNTLGNF
jgi:hypothetical protein